MLFGQSNRRRSRWEIISNDDPIETPTLKPDPLSWDDSTITAAWIGHSTVLINFFGTRIITDPVLYDRVGLDFAGLFTLGPKRLVHSPLTPEELGSIDLILVSHAHMDHLDTATLRTFSRSTPIVMARNTTDLLDGRGFDSVYELDWGQWTQVGDTRIEALEVKHFGWRYPWERDRSRGYEEGRSYNAYLVSKRGQSILFAGDTAYHEKFRKLAQRTTPIILAVMPIGAYDPWIQNHATPEQALAMANHMGARYILPVHWRTFVQSEEPTLEPMERLKKATAGQPERIVLDSIGQTWTLSTRMSTGEPPADSATARPFEHHP